MLFGAVNSGREGKAEVCRWKDFLNSKWFEKRALLVVRSKMRLLAALVSRKPQSYNYPSGSSSVPDVFR